MRQKSSPLLPFRGIKHCEAPHKRSDRQRSARQPECVTNGLKCGPMIVAPQNAIPVEDGMCFHGRLLFENFSSLRRTLCHPVTASHPVIECFSCPSYGRYQAIPRWSRFCAPAIPGARFLAPRVICGGLCLERVTRYSSRRRFVRQDGLHCAAGVVGMLV